MKPLPALIVPILTSMATIGTSFADENPTLPGVQAPKPIVTAPPPEPDRMTDPSKPNTFRIGNTDVTISGDITVDVGTMKSPRK
ncbi:hypothetical protein [Brucella sp. IR073]|uniref:hypothetical protein n=1 Tax=unclassified Brucella TaxID=2632610 RepID=UPI003B981EDC